MSQILDRRQSASKSTSMVNRQRFLRRYKNQIKEAVSEAAGKRSITQIDQGEKVSLPIQDLSEPRFYQDEGGLQERILPGNDQFVSGDRLKRPPGAAKGQGSSQEAQQQGEGQDDFIFQLSREEFLDLYFEDLELPDLVKKDLVSIQTYKKKRIGITNCGIPTNLNIVRSMRQAFSRKIALGKKYKRRLELAETEQSKLSKKKTENKLDLLRLQSEIDFLKKKIKTIPFLDTIDLRYNNLARQPVPSTQAVMFCIMDVSGSMDEVKKDIAKRFFILLYLFLRKNYEKIEVIFIRHHTSAKEVNEEEFFYSRETGGTVVSSALELLSQIINARFPASAWNIYVAQASDGDNWNADSPYCQELLQQKVMSLVQYYAYVEIMPRHHQSLWEAYQKIYQQHRNFSMENIDALGDIYPVFRTLFKRKVT